MSDPVFLTGECFCGAVRYQISAPLKSAQMCHCSRCRKAFSGAGSAMAGVTPGSFSWLEGEAQLNLYEGRHGYGIAFCRTCGTTLCGTNRGDVMGITLGTLNENSSVKIARHIFVGSKADWDEIGGDAPKFDGAVDT